MAREKKSLVALDLSTKKDIAKAERQIEKAEQQVESVKAQQFAKRNRNRQAIKNGTKNLENKMVATTMTAAEQAVERLEVGGFNSRSLEEALAAPRAWDDAHSLIVQSDSLIVELWNGPEGDNLIQFEDQSYVYFYGCTGGARNFNSPMELAFMMPSIEKEMDEWKLVFSHDRHDNGGTIHFYGSRKKKESSTKPVTTDPQVHNSQMECNNEN